MNFADQLERIVKSRIEKDSLTLPTLPAVAIRAIELTRTADFNLQAATSLIEKDPVLAVQVLRLCKSAAVATREPCNTIGQAISRLGAKNLRGVLLEISSRRSLESRDPKVTTAVKTLWEHSRAVAQLAQRVAVVSGASDPNAEVVAAMA